MLSHYRLVEKIGEGGMGVVWKAEDTKLGRAVAVKILPEEVASSPDRLARFEREAKLLAALDHPGIVTIHSVEEAEGVRFLTMELVRGRSLSSLIGKHGLPLNELLQQAIAISDAVSAAHRQGITHRDLKPENIMVGDDGRVKVLDFGVGKLKEEAAAGAGSTQLPTVVKTEEGHILGTVAYMSPEQAEGKPLDHRTDIFSLGIVLYEMATGRRPFTGGSRASIISSILRDTPSSVSELNEALPRDLGRIVRHSLEKDPERRFQTVLDVRNELEELKEEMDSGAALPRGTEVVAGGRAVSRRSATGLWVLLGIVLGAGLLLGAGLATGAFTLLPRPTPEPPIVRTLTFSGVDSEPAASPDGRTLAFASTRDGVSRIWLKQLAEGSEVPLTAGPDFSPRFSPDGSAVLFSREETDGTTSLYRVPVLGGNPRKVVHDAVHGDWSPDGKEIAFIRLGEEHGVTVARVGLDSIDGGSERVVRAMDNLGLGYPRFSPDGRWIGCIGTPLNTLEGAGGYRIVLVRTDGSEEIQLSPREDGGQISAMAWLGSPDEIIYSQGESAATSVLGRGVAVDTGSNRIVRQNIETGEGSVLFWSPSLSRVLDVVAPGRIVYESMTSAQNLREFEIAAGAEAQGVLLSQGTSIDRQPVYSPDGEWLAYSSNRAGNLDIWARSTRDGSVRRLTDHTDVDFDPAFTQDGSRLIFSSRRGGNLEIWTAILDGSGARQVSRDGVDAENATATPDGAWLVYNSGNPERRGIWKVRADGSDAALLVPGSPGLPELSPDGRYVSYVTTRRSGLNVVHVARVEDGEVLPFEILLPGGNSGNGRSRWMPDGRAIAFTWTLGGVSGVFVQEFLPGEDTSSTRRPLVRFGPGGLAESFAISPDGKRITVAVLDRSWSLMSAENLPGVTPPSR
jgi:Tol biopolymer transport system component